MLYMANYVVFSGLYRIRPLRPLCFLGGHIGKFFFFGSRKNSATRKKGRGRRGREDYIYYDF